MTEIWTTLDLASKQSAWNVSTSDGEILEEGDSLSLAPREFVSVQAGIAKRYNPDIFLIEDVPYGISSQAMVKPVLRLQGMLLEAIYSVGYGKTLLFVNPGSWQKYFDKVSRGPKDEREEAARMHAFRAGYEPPNLVQEYLDNLPEGKRPLKTHMAPLAKTMTDYIDAFLMQEYLRKFDGDITSHSGVQPPSI